MLRLAVFAHPGARFERVARLDAQSLGVWVRARAVEGQANAAIERAIADSLGLKPRQVRLVSGLTARLKIVEIDLPDPQALDARLLAHAVRATRSST
jgi:uncharacterized protein YggU (UPF0235/DUF167 family)